MQRSQRWEDKVTLVLSSSSTQISLFAEAHLKLKAVLEKLFLFLSPAPEGINILVITNTEPAMR